MNNVRKSQYIFIMNSSKIQLIHLVKMLIQPIFKGKSLKVLGKSVGLCKTSKRKDQLYISLLVSVWRIICENFNPIGLILAEI